MGPPFWNAFSDWVRDQGVISEFVRFSLFQKDLLDYPGNREERQQNVVRALQVDDAVLWMDFDHKVRKNVNRAKRSGVSIEADPQGNRLEEFLRLYTDTMDRRNAGDVYRFSRKFFDGLLSGLGACFTYFHAVHNGKVVSTELVLISAETVYSFLGGTDSRSFQLRPNDLLKYEIMRWFRDRGKKEYVLGGGARIDDGVFRYKRAFAPRGCTPFFVGKRIFEDKAYRRLIEARVAYSGSQGEDWSPRSGFFPEYRA